MQIKKNSRKRLRAFAQRVGVRPLVGFFVFVLAAGLFMTIMPVVSLAQWQEPTGGPGQYSGSGTCTANPSRVCILNGDCAAGDTCRVSEVTPQLNASTQSQRKA